jgi:glycosyltransferase involved in cell wall biosynthesis
MEASASADERRKKVHLRGGWSRDPIMRRQTMKQVAYRSPARPFLAFLYLYLVRRGFLDGRGGFRYCILRAMYEYMIDVKLKEQVWNEGQRPPEKKIVFVNRFFSPDHSATSQLLSDLAFDLASRGQDIHVITGGQLYTDPGASLLSEEMICGVKVHRVRTSRFGRARLWGRMLDYLTFYLGATWRLLRSIQPGDVVVAKTDPPMMSVCAAWAAKLRKGVLVNWVQDLFPEVATSMDVYCVRFVAPMLKRLRNGSLQQGRSNVVLGGRMAQRLRDEGVPSDRITVIENWADGDVIQPVAREDNPLLREWQLDGKFVLGYSGNMGHVHEFKTMIDAAELLRNETEIAFVFIGAGIARSWLEDEVAKRGLTNVQFRPYQPADRLKLSLSLPDVHFVSLRPTLEGLIVPSKFYGIAAAGRPIIHIGDPDGEIAQILEREQCGWSYCIGEVGPLVKRIRTLSVSRNEATDAGLRARLAFDRQYSRTQALQTWRELLDSVSVPLSVLRPEEKAIVQVLPVAVGKD